MSEPTEKRESPLVHSVAIAEFDIKVGVTLSHIHPPTKLDKFQKGEIASLCLPDGGHKVAEDWTYMVFGDDEDQNDESKLVYGLSYFRNVPDPSQPRGAVQMSMLLILKKPYFLLFRPIVREALHRFMDDHDVTAIQTVYETLSEGLNQSVQLTMFNKPFMLNIPSMEHDPFPGASLTELVEVFGEATMLLWYASLMNHRILFVGSTGETVGNSCLAVPLLTLPLAKDKSTITPYVQLTDMTALNAPSYICGSSNPVMENMKQLYDTCGNYEKKTIISHTPFKLTSKDKALIKTVTKGIAQRRGEKWVRRQFFLHTQAFLRSCADDMSFIGSHNAKECSAFLQTDLYKTYVEERAQAEANAVPDEIAAFQKLQEAQENDEVTAVQLMKYYYELNQVLGDLEHIEKIIDLGGVGVVSHGLTSTSSQIRKYSINLTAKLAISVKGQYEIIALRMLPTIADMLQDKLPGVVSAAAMCLQKISCLYVGAEALSEEKDTVQSMIDLIATDTISADDIYCIASTLSQLYATLPDAPVPNADKNRLLCPPDGLPTNMRASYVDMIIELIDAWGMNLPVEPIQNIHTLHEPHLVPNARASVSVSVGSSYTIGMSSADDDGEFKPNPAIARFLGSLQSTSNTRAKGVGSALRELHTLIEAKKSYAVQAANLGAVQILYRKGFLLEHNGHYRAWETLAFLSGTTAGMLALHDAQIIRFILFDISSATKPSMHLLYAVCMLEGILQKPGVADEVYDLQGVDAMVQFVLNHGVLSADDAYDSLQTDTMELGHVKGTFEEELLARDFAFVCLPVLRCLRYVFRCVTRERAVEMKKSLVPLGHLLNLDVDLTDPDRSDFQTLLMSLLVTVGALNMSYLDWIVRARQQVNTQTDDNEPLLSVDYNQASSGRRVTISMKGTDKPAAPAIAQQQEEALRSGFLEKQMMWRQSWKKRWCILTPSSLFYYKVKGGKPAGIVPLALCQIHQKTEKQYFDIVLKSKRIKLRASSPEEASSWIRTLELAKDKLGPLTEIVEEPKQGIAARLKGMLGSEKKSETSSPQQSPRSTTSNRSHSPSQSRAFSYGQQSLSDTGSVFPPSIRQSEVIRRAGETVGRGTIAAPVVKPLEKPVLDFERSHLTRPGSTQDLNAGLPGIDETQEQQGDGKVPYMAVAKKSSTRSNRHIRHESWTFPRPP